MRVLLVNPEFPESYWSGRHALPFVRKKCLLPPLGLLTVAALLPRSWDLRLVDLNVESLSDEEISRAEVVMLTGMIVQRASLQGILARCRRLGVRTVVGGPYATAVPDELPLADHLVLGEAEGVAPVLASDLAAGRARRIYREDSKPDMTRAPVPRYDLLRVKAYHQMSLQYSRGCPFNCEFCDIISLYGRKPRTKTAAQVIAELDAIRATRFKGDIFFVDDNFIGNKRAVKEVLPEIARWRDTSKARLNFYTEASMNLADDPALISMMTEAGFTTVFIGIETPSPECLRETGKTQNLKRDLVGQVQQLRERGLDVSAGFILGFDNDGPDAFDRLLEFIRRAAIPYAMVGVLGALPNTRLYRRLEKEGRLRPALSGDQFGLTNVITKLPVEQMIAGYHHVLQTLYQPEEYFRRCRETLARWKPAKGVTRPIAWGDLVSAWRAIRGQGITGCYRRSYWRFLRWVVRHHPRKLGWAISQAAAGHHFITYTATVVLPGLVQKTSSPLG